MNAITKMVYKFKWFIRFKNVDKLRFASIHMLSHIYVRRTHYTLCVICMP